MFGRVGSLIRSNFQTFCSRSTVKYYRTIPIPTDTFHIAKMPQIGMPLGKVVNVLEEYASTSLAESWDNVGLLVEPSENKMVQNILLTNDLTEDVVEEAISLDTNLIICYHPVIFAPLKSVTTKTWKERIIVKCIENKIAVFSPHTSFDSIKGGVNDWLVSAFAEAVFSNKPIQPNADNPNNGIGRICALNESILLEDAVKLVKKHTGLQYLKVARVKPHAGSDIINTIAVCAGSGASVLKGVKADLYLTGEMSHHDLLDAIHNGSNVILTNHSDSERGFLKVFSSTLYELLNKSVNVNVSDVDKDPLETV